MRNLQLLRERDAAALLAVAPKTLRAWRVNGGGRGPPFIKISGAVRYAASDLIGFIEKHRRRSTSANDEI